MAKAPDPKDPDGVKARAAKAAREKAKAKAKAFHDYEVVIHLDDRAYKFTAGDVTARHVGLLRQATGSTLADPVYYALLVLAEGDAVLPDLVAQLVFLARLQAGEQVTLDEVADGITGRTVVWLEFPEGPDGERVQPDPGGEGQVFQDPPVSGGC